ncbi:MAG: hypothetical protein V7727_10825, partial [Sneathiella sp.]
MSDKQDGGINGILPEGSQEFADNMAKISMKSMDLVNEFYSAQSTSKNPDLDPLNIGSAFLDLANKMMAEPEKLVNAQAALWQGYMNIWQNMAAGGVNGQETKPGLTSGKG